MGVQMSVRIEEEVMEIDEVILGVDEVVVLRRSLCGGRGKGDSVG